MEGKIIGEDDVDIGTKITDNGGVEHQIEMHKHSGEIYAHDQDGYPDKAAKRTGDENEYVSQARRHAKYYVAEEKGYDVLPWDRDTASMQRVQTAIESLSEEQFEAYFGTYFDQINSRLPKVTAPVPEPDAVGDDEFVLYMLDVYLDDAGGIEATSDIHFLYLEDNREKQVVLGEQPLDREPDARLQLTPNYLPSLEVAREFFIYHLRCQIRDCYVLRGEEPPEQYRVIGPGLYDAATRYLYEDRPYRPYHKLHADIPGYSLDFDYGFGEQGKAMGKIAGAVADHK